MDLKGSFTIVENGGTCPLIPALPRKTSGALIETGWSRFREQRRALTHARAQAGRVTPGINQIPDIHQWLNEISVTCTSFSL